MSDEVKETAPGYGPPPDGGVLRVDSASEWLFNFPLEVPPEVAASTAISWTAKGVYAAVLSYLDPDDGSIIAYDRKLAEESGLSLTRLLATLEELRRTNMLDWDATEDGFLGFTLTAPECWTWRAGDDS